MIAHTGSRTSPVFVPVLRAASVGGTVVVGLGRGGGAGGPNPFLASQALTAFAATGKPLGHMSARMVLSRNV